MKISVGNLNWIEDLSWKLELNWRSQLETWIELNWRSQLETWIELKISVENLNWIELKASIEGFNWTQYFNWIQLSNWTLLEGLWGLILLGFFISHWGLSYALSSKSKAIYQLNRFPRERDLSEYVFTFSLRQSFTNEEISTVRVKTLV